MKYLTYLACPYTYPHADKVVRDSVQALRFNRATLASVALLRAFNWNVFSPITHSHPMHLQGLDGDWEFWKRIDTEYLEMSQRMVVLTIDGWFESTGVQAEIKIARGLRIPVYFMSAPHYVPLPSGLDGTELSFDISQCPHDVDQTPRIYEFIDYAQQTPRIKH